VTAIFFIAAQNLKMQQQNPAAEQTQARTGADRKIEVVFDEREGAESVSLKYLTWTDGLGWCCQKTINVEADHLDELHRAITVARHRVGRRRADGGLPTHTAQVIRLPTLG
jgi:hypothetical protein